VERFLLDTNIVVFILLGETDKLSKDVKVKLWEDYNLTYTSSVCVMEIIQLYRIGKIKSKKYKSATELIQAITREFGIKILPFAEEHSVTLTRLKIIKEHNDPFDHAIISHAITEKMVLISTDKKIQTYTNQKLKFIYNKY